MVQVKLEVRTGTARFRVSVRAQSAQRAVSLTGARYPGAEVRMLRRAAPVLAGIAAATRTAGSPREAAA